MEKLLIFPCNGNGLEALSCIENQYELIGFIDDQKEKQGTHLYGFKIYSREALLIYPEAKILAVPGSPASYMNRDKIIDGLHIEEERYARVIHPKASVSKHATIGNNVLIMAGTVVTYNSVIGNHVCILPNSVIHHDSIIGNFTLIGSNVTIAGYTKVGSYCYIGSGTSIINNIEIGSYSLIGMGTNVIRSIPEKSKAVGNPATLIK